LSLQCRVLSTKYIIYLLLIRQVSGHFMTIIRPLLFVFFAVFLSASAFAESDEKTLPGQGILDKLRNEKVDPRMAESVIPKFMDGPTKDDIVYRMLKRGLGDPAIHALSYFSPKEKDAGFGGVTAVTYVLSFFPYIALVVSSIFTAYMFFAGMFSTATTGELLGKKWDTWTMPVRTSTAYIFLLPVPPFSPFSGIQVIVLVLSLLGIGMASATFTAVVKHVVGSPTITIMPADAHQFVYDIAKANLCMDLGRKHGVLDPAKKENEVKELKYTIGSAFIPVGREDNQNEIMHTSIKHRFEFGKNGVCGHTTIEVPVKLNPNNIFRDNLLSDQLKYTIDLQVKTEIPKIISAVSRRMHNKIAYQMLNNEEIVYDDVWRLEVAKLIDTETKYVEGRLNKAATLKGKQDDLVDSFTEELTRYGFATAGMVYWSLERRQDAFINAVQDALPKFNSYSETAYSFNRFAYESTYGQQLRKEAAALKGALDVYIRRFHPNKGLQQIYEKTTDDSNLSQAMSDLSTYIGGLFLSMPRKFAGGDENNPSPLLEVKLLGQAMQASVLSVIAVQYFKDKLGFFGKWIPSIGDDGDEKQSAVGGIVSSLVSTLLKIMLLLGFIYANILPSMPYLMWTIAVVGYVIYVFESLIACNFWIAMKAHPDGEGFIGKSGAGYPIIMTLILYPILMIAGLLIGMAILRLGGWLINLTLEPFWQDMSTDGVNLASFIGMLVVNAIMYLLLIYKSLSLTYETPTGILRWMGIGSHFTDMGEKQAQQQALTTGGTSSQMISETFSHAASR